MSNQTRQRDIINRKSRPCLDLNYIIQVNLCAAILQRTATFDSMSVHESGSAGFYALPGNCFENILEGNDCNGS